MNAKEIASCILTVKLLRTLAHNIHGFMDIIDEQNCEKIIKLLESQTEHKPDCEHAEHDSGGCLGYGRSEQDDEPIDACKECEKYTGN